MTDRNPDEKSAPEGSSPLQPFVEGARALSLEAFAERYGSAFLLVSEDQLRPPESSRDTLVRDSGSSLSQPTSHLSLSVHPVRRTERSLFPFITTGRTSNNDMVIRDTTVSRFHAFLQQGEDGSFTLQDAGSTNGTAVNGVSVAAQDKGPPTVLRSGDTVRFGTVETTFLDAAALRDFLLEFEA